MDKWTLQHPAGRTLSLDWSEGSFTVVVCANILFTLAILWTENSELD